MFRSPESSILVPALPQTSCVTSSKSWSPSTLGLKGKLENIQANPLDEETRQCMRQEMREGEMEAQKDQVPCLSLSATIPQILTDFL